MAFETEVNVLSNFWFYVYYVAGSVECTVVRSFFLKRFLRHSWELLYLVKLQTCSFLTLIAILIPCLAYMFQISRCRYRK